MWFLCYYVDYGRSIKKNTNHKHFKLKILFSTAATIWSSFNFDNHPDNLHPDIHTISQLLPDDFMVKTLQNVPALVSGHIIYENIQGQTLY